MKYTQISPEAFSRLQLNAGILVSHFVPATGEVSGIIGATTGGVKATCPPTIVDFGEDMDNVPAGTKQLQKINGYEPRISGTFLTVVAATLKTLLAAADIDSLDATHITLRHDLTAADFDDVWFVGDYSDKNGNSNGGFIAIHLKNALNTDGFSLQTAKNGKGQFAVNFRGFYDLDNPDDVPMEFYILAGTDEPGGFALAFASEPGATAGKTKLSGMNPTPDSGESYVYQTGYNLQRINAGDILLGSAWTVWNGTADIAATTGMEILLAIITTTTGEAQHGGKTIVVAKEA